MVSRSGDSTPGCGAGGIPVQLFFWLGRTTQHNRQETAQRLRPTVALFVVVDFSSDIPLSALIPNIRVALRSDSYLLHSILPNKTDPLVALMMVEKVPDSTYEMVGGLDKQIKEIKEVIELPVKHPELFESLGIAQPKGVLLYGPPGTGKTLLARAVAHHTDCRFIRVSGSELVQKYIGEGSRMVRELFVMAREHAPSIIFMDEIDSIGSSRGGGGGSGGGDSEVQRTMLELLNQLDGFEPSKNIKVSGLLRAVARPSLPGKGRAPHTTGDLRFPGSRLTLPPYSPYFRSFYR